MNNTGLVSISFRKHSPEEIIAVVAKAGLKYIEWGSDIHVPQGDVETAEKIRALMLENGLECSSYGSYYKLTDDDFLPFLKSAAALKAPIIRVWAGTAASAGADGNYRKSIVKKSREIADISKEHGIKVAFEYHPGTLTDNRKSALWLMEEINHPNIGVYWQPNFALSHDENLLALKDVLPYVDIIHTFSWLPDSSRLLLGQRAGMWKDFIGIARAKTDIRFLLEFVKDDDLNLLYSEAEELRGLLM